MLAVAILPCKAASLVGPLDSLQGKRDKYSLLLNETSSRVDEVFHDKTDLISLNAKASQQVKTLPTDEEIADSYAEMIEEHLERRIAFVFEQLIACYKTKLHFEAGETRDQGESPDRVALSDGKKGKEFQRNAAHSSTIPCLIAFDQDQWKQYEKGKMKKPDGFVFLEGTDSYRNWNATMNMPRFINEADICIDGRSKGELLRKDTLELINRVSKGELTPDEALESFLKNSMKHVEDNLKKDQKTLSGGKRRALELYRDCLKDIKSNFKADKNAFLESLLDLNLKGKKPSEVCRKALYMIRFRAIRDSQLEQSKIVKKINAVRDEILNTFNRKPNCFDAAFRLLLIEQARTGEDRTRLEKLYNLSSEDYSLRLDGARKRYVDTTKELLKDKFLKKIEFVAREALADMRTLRTQEVYQRGDVTREIRNSLGLTQVELGEKIKKKFPRAAASQSSISRIENQGKLVTRKIAEELSETFKVPTGLFMPHFFYE